VKCAFSLSIVSSSNATSQAPHTSLAANGDHSQQSAAFPNSSGYHAPNGGDVLQSGRPLYILVPEQNVIRLVFFQVAELSRDRCWQAKCFLAKRHLESMSCHNCVRIDSQRNGFS